MAISKPRVLYNSISYQAGLVGGIWTHPSSEDTDYPVSNLGNWAAGSKWAPEEGRSLLSNGDMLLWAGGASAAPDSWTLTGAGATVAQSTTVPTGGAPYSAAITRAGTDCYLTQSISSPTSYKNLLVTAGGWAYATVASRARISVYDSSGNTDSSYHTGGSSWEWLEVSHSVVSSASSLSVRLRIDTGDTTAYFDGVVAVLYTSTGDLVSTPLPETAYVNFVCADGQLLDGWFFNVWTNGAASAPDSWALTGASATTYRTMANSPKVGHSAAGVTRAGTDCYLGQSLSSINLAKVLGKAISAGCWAYATAASRAYVDVVITHRDSSTTSTTSSTAHTGGSSYEWLEVENVLVPYDATAVQIRLSVKTGNTSVEWSGAWLGLGTTATQTPHSKTATAFAMFGHNLGTCGGTAVLQHSTDQSSWTDAFTAVDPSSDYGIWRDFGSLSKSYWRLKVTAGSGTQRPYIGLVAFGEYLELPHYMPLGWDPLQRPVRGLAPENAAGYPIGRTMLNESKRLRIAQEHISETEIETLLPWLDACGGEATTATGAGRGHPFILQWDDGDHESWDDAGHSGGPLLCHIPSGSNVRIPLTYGIRCEDLSIEVRAVAK